VKRSASSSSLAAPPQTYSVAGPAARITSSRRAGFQAQLCRASQAKSGTGESSTTVPSESTDRASKGSSSASMDASPRRASTAAIVDFPAPDIPVINAALIGIHRRPARKAAQTNLRVPDEACGDPQCPAGGTLRPLYRPAPSRTCWRGPAQRAARRNTVAVPDASRVVGAGARDSRRSLARRAATPQARGGEQARDVSEAVSASIRISARPDEVFPYLVDAELVVEWLGSWADLDPVPGGRFHVDILGQAMRGEFVAVEPHHRVVFTWGAPGSERMPLGRHRWRFSSPPTAMRRW
jgi:Activator of Hsp90 ATPase homolog 1-like protein